MNGIDAILKLSPVIPVLTIEDAQDAVPLVGALIEGGLRVFEVTLRTAQACAAIEAIARALPDAVVGAGTVLDARDFERARDAGARFIVSPGLSDNILSAAKAGTLAFLPGVATAGEVMRGLDSGLTHFKFFPAEASGGTAMLKAFAGPFAHVRFCPTGGITPESAPSYLALPNVVCIGGTWLAPKTLVVQRNWSRIAQLAHAASRLARPITADR
jgi:2-dehydro-3-deoxyphosphogluconate aldolase/(4S)-4-hydroxy-2-oxoglutarate aldolase